MKVLLVPLAILAFAIFLLVLGAIGFAVSFAILAMLDRLRRLVFGGRPRER